MKRSKRQLLLYAIECGISDRMAYADAYAGADEKIRIEALEDVKAMRRLHREFGGAGSTFRERGIAAIPGKMMSITEIKKALQEEEEGKNEPSE